MHEGKEPTKAEIDFDFDPANDLTDRQPLPEVARLFGRALSESNPAETRAASSAWHQGASLCELCALCGC